MKFDVAIVGASIAGLYAGLKLSRAGRRVCIIDRRAKIGVPVRCGEATGNRRELSRFFPVDESWIACDIRGMCIHVNDRGPLRREVPDAGVMLHRDRLENALAEQAASLGAEIRLQTLATGLVRGGGRWDAVATDKGGRIDAQFIIGADGSESSVGRWAGLTRCLSLGEVASTVEYRIESDFCDDGHLHFFVGSQIIPPGYVWVFPKSNGTILVGGGMYASFGSTQTVREYVDLFIERRIPGAAKRDMISGCVPLVVSPRALTRDNVVIVGDAARQVNPLTAGGIMNALEAADIACERIVACDGGNFRKVLAGYSKTWARNQRSWQKVYALLRNVLLDFSDLDLELCLERASKIFGENPNRNRLFTPPLVPMLRFALTALPHVVKHRKVLWS